MTQHRFSICTWPPTRVKSLKQGRYAKELWTASTVHLVNLPRLRWGRCPCTATRAQWSVQPQALNPSGASQRSPVPPQLKRAGDLTGRLLSDYLSGWKPQYTEYDYYVPAEAVYGTVPEDIRGTLFLIGPALTEAYGTSVRHPSDADGMVCSLAFGDGGQIFFRNRYVRTNSFVAEQAVGRRLTRGRHDRGAPLVVGQQHSREQQQQQQQHQQHQHQQHHRVPAGARGKSAEDGRAAAAAAAAAAEDKKKKKKKEKQRWTSFEDDEDNGELEEAAAAGAASAAAIGRPAMQLQLQLPPRWDPFSLLGLPPPPPLSALFNPLDLGFRAPANASVVLWAGRLLAFTEGGSLPYELNKLSLETVGQYDMAGAMADLGRLVGGYKIAPAPPAVGPPTAAADRPQGLAAASTSRSSSISAATSIPSTSPSSNSSSCGVPNDGGERPQRLVVMGAAQSGPDTLLRWVEVGEDGAPAGPPITYRMAATWAEGLMDFWVTDRYYVVIQPPLDFNPQRFATEATLGAASFIECFDWDAGRPARIHLVPRPPGTVTATPTSPSSSSSSSSSSSTSNGGKQGQGRGRGTGVSIGGAPFVWPAKGPEAIVVDVPPLLPVSCVGCYSLTSDDKSDVLVLDATCQQGLPGSGGGALDELDPEEHRRKPKPELVRLVVDLRYGTASTRVLSQRTASAATTAATPDLTPVGQCSGGIYHHLYAAVAASDAAEGWAPSQVLLKLAVPPDHAVPAAAAAAAASVNGNGNSSCNSSGLARRRGIGAEIWSPGDRVFVGPPVFVPRKGNGVRGAAADVGPADAINNADGNSGERSETEQQPAGALPLPSMAVGREAAASREMDAQDGWLMVVLHDAESMVAELCVLDASDVTRGPVAVIRLPHHLPHVRGAHFTRSYVGPGLAAPPGWRPRTAVGKQTAASPDQ